MKRHAILFGIGTAITIFCGRAVLASNELVIAKNRANATVEYEVWTADGGFCDTSRETMISSGRLGPSETVSLDCRRDDGSHRPGFCIRWRDIRNDNFTWGGITCSGAGVKPPPVKNIN